MKATTHGTLVLILLLLVSGPLVADEFEPLFDGKSLAGWQLMNGAKFLAADGVLKHNGGLGWLRSDKQYSNFILQLELRFLKAKQDGGVFVRSGIEGKNWPGQKYEVQIENTVRMAKIFGAKHNLDVDLTQQVLKPLNDWNTYEIKIVGPKAEVRLNGKLVSTSNDLGRLKKGYIGFQGENGAHEYRNIRIQVLGD